jgi:prepilin signal peptidase PulO-like enzyme (type II secretory pathway)
MDQALSRHQQLNRVWNSSVALPLKSEVRDVMAKYWALFGVIQAVGIMLVSVSNIHTNVLPLILGYPLLGPGIFISSRINLVGSVQSVIVAVALNALLWHFLVGWSQKKDKAR